MPQRILTDDRPALEIVQRFVASTIAGGDLDSTGLLQRTLRVVVGQLATLKADYKFYMPKKTSHWQPN